MWSVRENGKPGLVANGGSLLLNLILRWEGQETVETAAMEAWFDVFGESTFWPRQRFLLGPEEVLPRMRAAEVFHSIVLPVDDRRLSLIESRRTAGDGRVLVNFNGTVYSRVVRETTLPTPDGKQLVVRNLAAPIGHRVSLQIVVERDQWLKTLQGLGWSETEVFELRAEPFRQAERLKKALAHLRVAEEAMRLCHWPSAVTEARKAVEVAAGIDGDMDAASRRRAFEKLISEVFPDPSTEPRREMASELMQTLAHFRNEGGAHGSVRFQLERSDAELSFRVATALFRYLSIHLAGAHPGT